MFRLIHGVKAGKNISKMPKRSATTNGKKASVTVFSAKPYDEVYLLNANKKFGHDFSFSSEILSSKTASLAEGCNVVCSFVNDILDKDCLEILYNGGTRHVALRCAGFDSVDLKCAERLNMRVMRVPAYSPYAVAEHAVALLLAVNRKIYRGYNRVREGNFALNGLLGFDMHGKTVGIIGTGLIGAITGNIFKGFGCIVVANDPFPNKKYEGIFEYVSLEDLYERSDIISLHCPLTSANHHIIDQNAIRQMKDGVTIVNTSRGGLLNSDDVIAALKTGKIGRLALDVYEHERALFFEDRSNSIIVDDKFRDLSSFPNVLITGHQAFFTHEALTNIADTTLQNIDDFANECDSPNSVINYKKGLNSQFTPIRI